MGGTQIIILIAFILAIVIAVTTSNKIMRQNRDRKN